MIKAAFFDIDGTLLSFTTHRVSAGTIRAFDRLHQAGIRTFLSTGRPDVLIPQMPVSFEAKITMNGGLVFVGDHMGANGAHMGTNGDHVGASGAHMGTNGDHVGANGNHMGTNGDHVGASGDHMGPNGDHVGANGNQSPDKVLFSNPVPDNELQAWLDLAKDKHLCTMIFTKDNMFLTQPNEIGLQLRNQLEFEMPPVVDIDRMRSETAYQIIAIMPGEMDATVAELLPHCRLPRWHPYFTDIVAHDNSKARGMEVICQHYGIRQEETLAFGDGANDIEMLEWAGIGVAMGNAADEVKKHADHVTTDVDNEGIENAVKEILK